MFGASAVKTLEEIAFSCASGIKANTRELKYLRFDAYSPK
jgi:hypothetical protein